MTILKLVTSPDPLLKKISSKVEKIDDKTQELMKNMLETMYQEQGIGLAAVQIGVLKKIIVIDVDYKLEINHEEKGSKYKILNQNPRFLVNAEIINQSTQNSNYKEGCLSFPGASSDVSRPKEVEVRYLDLNGKQHTEKMSGLLATCVQHEVDHTNGITFVDHISKLKRDMILKKMAKRKKDSTRSNKDFNVL